MKNILLVTNDDTFSSQASTLLRTIGHRVSAAADGERAIVLTKKEKFDLVISEIRLPKLSVPVILVAAHSEIQGLSSSNDFGTAGFLAKPFHVDDVERVIAGIVDSETVSVEAGLDDNFCRVPIDELVGGGKIGFSVYHRLDKNKFVKIAHRGDDLESSRIGNYRAKGLKDFYLAKSDFAKFVDPSLDLTKTTGANEKIPAWQKEKFFVYTTNLIKRQILVEGADADVFENAVSFVQTILRLVEEQPQTFNLLESLNRHADHLYAHALGVAVYGVMLARQIGWNSSSVLYKVSMAGFFHDIGMKMIAKDLSLKTRFEMTFKDRDVYDTHPRHSMESLKHIPGASEDILLACLQHHEDCLGQGYPQKLMGAQIVPMARLIGLADAFCELTIAIPGKTKLSASEAIEKILEKGRAFDPDFVSGLKVLFNIAVDPSLKKVG